MRYRILISLHGCGMHDDRIALMQWVVTRLVDAMRDSPVPITVELKTDEDL